MRISDWSSDVCSSDLAVYCASGVVAGARLFESVFGLPYEQALWWGAAATIIYTLVGGFLAVSWTDTLPAGLMFFALLLAPSRSEERRVGKECVSERRFRCWRYP